MKKFSILLFLILITLVSSQKHNVTQLYSTNLQQSFNSTQYSLLYVYSSSCGYCREFTPLFQKLSTNKFYSDKNVRFFKIDGETYKEQLKKYDVYSYPTVLLFWKGYVDYPIWFREERNEENIKKFIEKNTKINVNKIENVLDASVYERLEEKIVIYHGSESSELYKILGLIWCRDTFFKWTLLPLKSNQQEKLVIGNKQLVGSNLTLQEVQSTIQKVFARVYKLGQQVWYRMFVNKQLGIVYVNPQNKKKIPKIFGQLAKQFPKVVFMDLTPDNSQYKAALNMFAVHDEQQVIAVEKRADGVFVANQTDKDSIIDFIKKVQRYQWPVHRKSQRSQKQQKLTRQNYHTKMATSQDVLLFLYRRHQKISKNLVDLFNHLRNKLKDNKNLLLLRCDVASNQIDEYLGFEVQTTPKVIFFRNRMKDKPIHYYNTKISQKGMIEFIMENTTFDWKDEWAEL